MILPAHSPGESVSLSPGAERDGVLLRNGYRATDRISFWLLLAHLPLVLALAPLRDTWPEALLWGG
ncbi:MAG TPA: hypothetical protein VFX98_14370, partial [Longimicrobiaceae bacterium]|nr:hypothetical protein [Longimicrobiaceae bacterium]